MSRHLATLAALTLGTILGMTISLALAIWLTAHPLRPGRQ